MSETSIPKYLTDPLAAAQVEMLRRSVEATVEALRAEGCNEQVVTRVTNRLIYGHPDGTRAYEPPNPDEQVSLDFLGLIAPRQTALEFGEQLAGRMATVCWGDEIHLAELIERSGTLPT